jgi:hypothetical protein
MSDFFMQNPLSLWLNERILVTNELSSKGGRINDLSRFEIGGAGYGGGVLFFAVADDFHPHQCQSVDTPVTSEGRGYVSTQKASEEILKTGYRMNSERRAYGGDDASAHF